MISAGLPLASRPHAPGRSNRAITSAKPAIRAISGRSRKLLTATPPPAVARPANGHRLLSLASQDANRGSESASIDDNVLASILSAAAVRGSMHPGGANSAVLCWSTFSGCMDV